MPAEAHKAAGARVCRAFALLCLLSFEAGAATWYVRPASGEYGAENGTSYADAFDGFGDLSASYGSVNPGDTIIACGDFGYADRQGVSNFWQVDDSGTEGSEITLSGDCSAAGGPSMSSIDGEGQVAHLIRTMANTDLIIEGFELTGWTTRAVTLYTNATTEKTTAKRITVRENYIHDGVDADGAGDSAIDSRGTDIAIVDNILDQLPGDGIFANGARHTISRNRVSNVGAGTSVEGDCIQLTEYVDGGVVEDNDCDHRSADEKQCYIINGEDGDNGAFSFRRNHCDGFTSAATPGACAYIGSSGAWVAEQNEMHGCDYSYRIAEMGALSRFSANLGFGAADDGILIGSAVTAATVTHNSIAGSGGPGISSATAGADIAVVNNAIAGSGGPALKLLTDNVEQYNAVFGNAAQITVDGEAGTLHASDITTDPAFIGGPNPTTAEGFRLSANSPLIAAGTDLGDEIADYFGDLMYDGKWDIGAFRRDSCYRRSRDGKLDMARTRAQVASRCLGIPGRYPEGL